MRSSGYYSESTAGARNVINDTCQMVIEALSEPLKHQDFVLQIMVPRTVGPAARCGKW